VPLSEATFANSIPESGLQMKYVAPEHYLDELYGAVMLVTAHRDHAHVQPIRMKPGDPEAWLI